MATKHTPGKWWAGSDDDAHMVYVTTEDGVEAVADAGRDDGDAEAEAANAQLMAAAPDLLAALTAFLHADPDVFADEMAAARAAIAKATAPVS